MSIPLPTEDKDDFHLRTYWTWFQDGWTCARYFMISLSFSFFPFFLPWLQIIGRAWLGLPHCHSMQGQHARPCSLTADYCPLEFQRGRKKKNRKWSFSVAPRLNHFFSSLKGYLELVRDPDFLFSKRNALLILSLLFCHKLSGETKTQIA